MDAANLISRLSVSNDYVIRCDCLELLTALSESSSALGPDSQDSPVQFGAGIDLAYIDPPFNTGARQQAEAGSFSDRWDSPEHYVQFLRPRIELIRGLLKHSGCILVHCDWRTSHHVRALLDDVFGPDSFVNHLIWAYGLGGSSTRRFARKHDDILFYGRTGAYHFEPPMVPSTSVRMNGRPKKATDVLDIPAINNMAAERTGYPTQKPLRLLEMLVKACSPSGGIVADFFCGSGTTLVAACRTGRRWLGCDIGQDAVTIARRRLAEARNDRGDI
ncbi:MAG: site-specific DNA-methyltransferase [Planctomycetes bacterium]|nr:site-specific DNA-methyltransferase [Planctomycetota bacterium]NOG54506.1 site-specific DNA-methyltransferase [Planctomycetota bacterium]